MLHISLKMNTAENVRRRVVINLNNYTLDELRDRLRAILIVAETAMHGSGGGDYDDWKDTFLKAFENFQDVRLDSIFSLNERANALDSHHKNVNISKSVASGIGFLGGTALLVGFGIITGGAGVPVALAAVGPQIGAAGGIIAGAGALGVFGTNATEKIIEKGHNDKIKKKLKRDKEITLTIFQWLQRHNEVKNAIETIMDHSIFEDILRTLVNEFKTQRTNLERGTPEFLVNFIDELGIPEQEKLALRRLLDNIFNDEICQNVLAGIIALYRVYFAPILKILKALTLALITIQGIDSFLNAENSFALIIARNLVQAPKQALAIGALGAISVAIDLYTFLETQKDIANGSKSNLAKKFRNCADKMKQELDTLTMIYEELKDND